jgi:BirA family biotin operon repressor/biotin-[acetyl-CoA-carboxylase] ligase
MDTKNRILAELERHRGAYLSGAALAERLGVSRNAVWKAVRALEAEGHRMEAAPRRGYRLSDSSGVLTPQSIAPYLEGSAQDLAISVFPSLPSTNLYLKEAAEGGAAEGRVVLADTQTAGYGRRGRAFFSPPGTGLYMSLLLRPAFSPQDALCLTTGAAVAVCRAAEDILGLTTQIKWVNDVFSGGKKVCGIATEAAMDLESGGLRYAVLGIGLNVFPPGDALPEELRGVAGSLVPAGASPIPAGNLRARLAAGILNRFWALYPSLTDKAYFADYRARSFLLGQEVWVLRGASREAAVALDLDADFRLRVRFADGREESLSSGEVSIRGRN